MPKRGRDRRPKYRRRIGLDCFIKELPAQLAADCNKLFSTHSDKSLSEVSSLVYRLAASQLEAPVLEAAIEAAEAQQQLSSYFAKRIKANTEASAAALEDGAAAPGPSI